MGMSTPFNEIARLCRITPPDIAVELNVLPVHVEHLGSIENVARAKAELVEGMKTGGTAILNADDKRVLAMVEHHEIFYADLKDPVALLKGEASSAALGKFWGYASGDGEVLSHGSVAGYTRLMGASNALVASQVLDAYPFAQHRVHLDIGGGDGTFVTAVAVKFPALTFKLFDLPAVAEVAKARIHAANLDSRIEVFGGSFLSDALPRGADIITLLRIIHDHNDEPVRQLLRASRAALQPGGILLIAEPMSDTAGSETVGDAYFGFYLMAMGSGEPRSAAKISSMVMDAGFQSVREVATHLPMQARLLVATA